MKIAIIQPFPSHEEVVLPIFHALKALNQKFNIVIFLPEEIENKRGNLFKYLNLNLPIKFHKSGKKGLQELRKHVEESYDLTIMVTFSNYLMRIRTPCIRIIHNAENEIDRIPQELSEVSMPRRYLCLADYVKKAYITLGGTYGELISAFYPFEILENKNPPVAQEPSPNQNLISIIGRVNQVRDYSQLLDYIKKYQTDIRRENIQFNILGDSGPYRTDVIGFIRNNTLNDCVKVYPQAEGDILLIEDLLDIVKQSRFIMPLLKSQNGQLANKTRISSAYSWIYALGIPAFHDRAGAINYPNAGLCYEGEADFFCSLSRSLASKNNHTYDYQELCSRLQVESLKLIKMSHENIRNSIQSVITS